MRGWVARSIAAIAVVCVTGLAATVLRLEVAGLPFGHGVFVVPIWASFLLGVVLFAVALGVFALSCLAADLAARRRWDFHGHDWAQIVDCGGVGPAWRALNQAGPEGERRRTVRAARAVRASSLRRARVRRRAAAAARVTRLHRFCGRLTHAAEVHERVAGEQAQVIAPPGGALGASPQSAVEPPADPRLRILAGANLLVLAGVVGLAAGQAVAEFSAPSWAVAVAGVVAALVVHRVLTDLGPLDATPRGHLIAWVVVIVLALLCTPAVGLLVLTGVVISTWGRRELRRSLLRSPLPWAVAGLYALVALAYYVTPPVSFAGRIVRTTSAEYVGGLLHRSPERYQLVQCTPLADATSTAAHLRAVPVAAAQSVQDGSRAAFDQGGRPALIGLPLQLFGVDEPQAVFVRDLRGRQPTCAGAPPPFLAAGREDPALGAGAIAGPAPAGGRALDGEAPIEQTTDPRIARLAKRYEPTLEVTVDDRFWPVSVGAALADVGPRGRRACLYASPTLARCRPVSSVPATGTPGDYLRFPVTANPGASALTPEPGPQFNAFEAGQHVNPGSLHHWLADPGVLDPWRSAQIYFYYAGPVHYAGVAGRLPAWPVVEAAATPADAGSSTDGLIGLQYWFFYPYNYYPLVVRTALENGAPEAGDITNVDLHQGDWEHVTVLLDARTLRPVALYTARHADEGVFYAWSPKDLTFDDGHPVVQAAIGGHPSYPAGCGQRIRTRQGGGLLSDWLVCGSGRFAFRAASTPLVDLAHVPWACWPGHFGEAKAGRELVDPTADTLTQVNAQYVHVAGPLSPLWQAENGVVGRYGVCDRGAGAAERTALGGVLAR